MAGGVRGHLVYRESEPRSAGTDVEPAGSAGCGPATCRGLQVTRGGSSADLQQIVEVPQEDLRVLTQESPGSQRGVQVLERAAASLYKALQAGMDQCRFDCGIVWTKLIAANAEVSATIARMKEYQENSAQFSKRIMDYLDVQFKYQVSYRAPELGPQLMGSPIRRYLRRVRAGRSRPRWRRIAQCASIS